VYEAFLQVFELNPRDEWKLILESIARHAFIDIKDFRTSERASSCSYTPYDSGGVINAAAYRSFLLTSASRIFSGEDYWLTAERNLNFVLDNQNPDGSWFYAVDGVRDFVDHFHTCFVMKALAKIQALTGDAATLEALRKGVSYYLNNLFDTDGLPKPFSRAPRLTVYKRELYDCAECINLCLLLRDRFPQLELRWRPWLIEFYKIGSTRTAPFAPGACIWVGTTSPCIAGDRLRCSGASLFISVRRGTLKNRKLKGVQRTDDREPMTEDGEQKLRQKGDEN